MAMWTSPCLATSQELSPPSATRLHRANHNIPLTAGPLLSMAKKSNLPTPTSPLSSIKLASNVSSKFPDYSSITPAAATRPFLWPSTKFPIINPLPLKKPDKLVTCSWTTFQRTPMLPSTTMQVTWFLLFVPMPLTLCSPMLAAVPQVTSFSPICQAPQALLPAQHPMVLSMSFVKCYAALPPLPLKLKQVAFFSTPRKLFP